MSKTDYFNFATAHEKENVELTLKHFGREIGIFKTSFDLFAKILEEIFPTFGRGKSLIDMALLPLTNHFLMSMKARYNLVMKGYYHEALIIYRNMLETLMLCIYVSQNQDQAVEWLDGRLRLKRVRSKLGLDSKESREIARYLSNYVHMNIPSIDPFTKIRLGKERRSIQVYHVPTFNKEYATLCIIPIFAQWLILFLSDKFNDRLSIELKDRISKHKQEIIREWKRLMVSSSKK